MYKNKEFRELRNPLLRRMNRHLNMATIYRMVDSAPVMPENQTLERYLQRGAPTADREAVRGFIWTPSSDDFDESAASETHISDSLPKKKYTGVSDSSPVHLTKEPQPSFQAVPEVQKQVPEDESIHNGKEHDGTWKRLQAIFNKHQEKGEDTQEEFNPDVDGKIPGQGKESDATGINVITGLYDAEKPSVVDRQRGREEGDSLEQLPTDNDQPHIHVQTSQRRESFPEHITKQSTSEHKPPLETTSQESSKKIYATQEAEKIETTSPHPPSEGAEVQTSQDPPGQTKIRSSDSENEKSTQPRISHFATDNASEALPASPSRERLSKDMELKLADDFSGTMIDDELDTQTHPSEAQPPQSELSEDPSDRLIESSFKDGQHASIQVDESQFQSKKIESGKEETPHPTGEIDTTRSIEPAKKPPPLEEVWPVQRKEERTSDLANEAAQILTSPSKSTGDIKSHSETDDPIFKRIKNLPAEGPTQSSVEYLPPLHPRPHTPGGSSAQIQTKMIGDQEKTRLDMPAQPQGKGPITQREDSIEPETIPTEIGPLPSDLWELIGHAPPSQTADQHRMPGISSRTEAVIPYQKETSDSQYSEPISSDDHPINQENTIAQRNVETVVSTQSPSKPSISDESFIHVPEIIQRQSESAPENASTARDDSESSTSAPQPGDQIDVDMLARQVYVEIKRRISIEWERMRGFK